MSTLSTPSRWRPRAPGSPSVPAGVLGLGLLALLAPGALGPLAGTHPLYVTGALVTGVVLVLLGAVVVRYPRSRAPGAWILLGGATWPLNYWGTHPQGLGAFLGWTGGALSWALLSLAISGYPGDATVADPWSHRFRWGVVGVFGPLNLAVALVARPEWMGFPADVRWPTLVARHGLFDVVFGLYTGGNFLLAVTGALVVVRRLRRLSEVDRAALRPGSVLVAVVVLATVLLYVGQAAAPSPDTLALTLFLQGLALLGIPAALALTDVRIRSGRAGIAGHIARLSGVVQPDDVREALRTTLRDPTLEVLYHRPEGVLVDGAGHRATAPEGRLEVPITGHDGSDLAVVYGDGRMKYHVALAEASVSAAGMALENARLQADLRARVAEVHSSRARILAAQQEERDRIERQLHDGAQQRLLALTLRVEAARVRTREPATAQALSAIRLDLQAALGQMRELAQGLSPALLAVGGLHAALEVVVERLPLPVVLQVPEGPLDPAAETTAYFVVCEALANVVKHARASGAQVTIWGEARQLMVRVTDDGIGGAALDAGSGLRGLSDRVQTVGGSLQLYSRPGAGTSLRVALPCP